MALSNILKEPRREAIETVIGVAVVVGAIFGDYSFAHWVVSDEPRLGDRIAGTLVLMAVTPIGVGILIVLFVLAHALGDGICNRLAALGADPRPVQRYLD